MMPFFNIHEYDDHSLNCWELITIDHKGDSYLYYNLFVTMCCLISSYIYVAIAAFRRPNSEEINSAVWWFEGIFVVDILINFLLTYDDQNLTTADQKEWDIRNTGTHYIQNNLWKDLLPTIPLQLMDMKNDRNQLFFLVKLMRLKKGFNILDEHKLMGQIKGIYTRNLKDKIENKP